jgi:hypothetical protein
MFSAPLGPPQRTLALVPIYNALGVAGISELIGCTPCEFTGPVSWRACWGSRGFSFRSLTFSVKVGHVAAAVSGPVTVRD